MRSGIFAFAALMAVAAPALAQTTEQPATGLAPGAAASPQNPAEHFKAYATSEGYKKTIGQMAVMGSTVSHPDCKDQKALNRAEMIFYVYPQFAEGMHPVSGVWQDRIRMETCGQTTYQNILLEAQTGGLPPKIALLMPGLTVATPPAQNLILKDVIDGLTAKKCADTTKIIPVDTAMDKETKPRKVNDKGVLVQGAWKETWTFRACGKNVKANVELSADGKGGLTHKVKL